MHARICERDSTRQNGLITVGSRGDVQLGGPVLACAVGVPLRLRLVSLFYSLKVPLKLKENQNTNQAVTGLHYTAAEYCNKHSKDAVPLPVFH